MDLSKLPKLSNSPAPADNDAPLTPTPPTPPPLTTDPTAPPQPATVLPPQAPTPLASAAAETWISIGLGLLILYVFPNTLKYLYGKMTGTVPGIFPDPTLPAPAMADFNNWLDAAGNVVKHEMYRDMLVFWSDAVITAFGLILILDGIVLSWARRPGVVLVVFAITILAVAANLFYLVKTIDQGVPLMSAGAILVGGYIAMMQWVRYRQLQAFAPRR